MLFKKLSTVERVYNIGLEDNNIKYLFDSILHFVLEAQSDLMKLYDLRVLDKIPVKDIMTRKMITLNENEPIEKLKEYIEKYRHMGYPVLDSNGDLKGIVTFTDLGKSGRIIKDIMTKKEDLLTVSPDTSASESQSIMAKNEVGRLLVVDENGKLIGLVSRGDIVKTYKTYSRNTPIIQSCQRITIFYFYDDNKYEKLKDLSEDIIMLTASRDCDVNDREGYIEILNPDKKPLLKIVKKDDKIDHISLTTYTITSANDKLIQDIFELIEKYKFEEIVVTDHITLVDEKSSIQRIITDVTLFKESKKTFGTVTIRSDF